MAKAAKDGWPPVATHHDKQMTMQEVMAKKQEEEQDAEENARHVKQC